MECCRGWRDFVIERSTGFAPNRNTSQAVFSYRDGSFTVDQVPDMFIYGYDVTGC